MMERPVPRDEREPFPAPEGRELAAFFRELGFGWEFDPERLIDRLANPRGRL